MTSCISSTARHAANASTTWSRHRGAGLRPATSAFEPTFLGLKSSRHAKKQRLSNTGFPACVLFFLIPVLSAQTLTGVIDIHAHHDPDSVPRSIDAIDLAKLAKSRGIRGLVLKNHYEPTASLAYIVRKEVPGIEIFGGISLDLTNGGVNPAAVEWMTKVKGGYGRVVWMPTYDSEHSAAPRHRPFA